MNRINTSRAIAGWAGIIVSICACTFTARAQPVSMPWAVIGSGGVIGASDGTYSQAGTFGQPVIGPGSVSTLALSQGFWLPLPVVIGAVTRPDASMSVAGAFQLRNYPNPFSEATTISYRLTQRSQVTVEIIDLLGHRVVGLVDRLQEAGEHGCTWDGTTSDGQRAADGPYFYQLRVGQGADAVVERRKLLLVR